MSENVPDPEGNRSLGAAWIILGVSIVYLLYLLAQSIDVVSRGLDLTTFLLTERAGNAKFAPIIGVIVCLIGITTSLFIFWRNKRR